MYFAKDEIITLNDNKKYLVLDTTIIENTVYYKIKEVSLDEKRIIGKELYVTTINKDGKIYINDKLSNEEIDIIKESFEN